MENFAWVPEGEYAGQIQPGTSEHPSELLKGKNLDSSVGNALGKPYRNARQKAQNLSKAVNRFSLLSNKPYETEDTVPPIQYNMKMSEEDEAKQLKMRCLLCRPAHISTLIRGNLYVLKNDGPTLQLSQ